MFSMFVPPVRNAVASIDMISPPCVYRISFLNLAVGCEYSLFIDLCDFTIVLFYQSPDKEQTIVFEIYALAKTNGILTYLFVQRI